MPVCPCGIGVLRSDAVCRKVVAQGLTKRAEQLGLALALAPFGAEAGAAAGANINASSTGITTEACAVFGASHAGWVRRRWRGMPRSWGSQSRWRRSAPRRARRPGRAPAQQAARPPRRTTTCWPRSCARI